MDVKIISHPSIRVKGTENEFDPVDCNDIQCSIKSFHMHCPFCVKTESYQDSRILKAHYHVKHVDKGIEFGGLKILRCCERCDIVGAIKEEKKFKGAHWHCFICKNGFNRRDEAIKHYKTHFRHPCTTLQIHVPQEVNKAMALEDKKGFKRDETKSAAIHIVSEAVITSTTPFLTSGAGVSAVILKNNEDTKEIFQDKEDQGTSITTTSENVSTDNQAAIVIIQEDQLAGSSGSNTSISQPINTIEDQEMESKWQLGKLVTHLQDQLDQLRADKDKMEKSLKSEVEQLKAQVQKQTTELDFLRKKKEEIQVNILSNSRLQQMISNLQKQHTEMLHQHIQQVKQEIYQSALKEFQGISSSSSTRNISNSTLPSNDQTVLALFLDNTTGIVSQTLPVSLSSTSQTPTLSQSPVTDNQVMPISIPLSLQSTYLSDNLTMSSLTTTQSNSSSQSCLTSTNSSILDNNDCPVVVNSSANVRSSKQNNNSPLYNPSLPTVQQLICGIAINNGKTEQASSDKLLIAIPSNLLSTPVSSSTSRQNTNISANQNTLASIDSAMIPTETNGSTPNSFVTCNSSFTTCPMTFCSEATNFNNTSYIITEGNKSCALQMPASGNLSYSELISSQNTEKRKMSSCSGMGVDKRRK
ncbi:serine-rich adhesin for platelets-like [Centruroides vittatus]|uniref:serine-rich adhesin for platelets-like n=1 Tax=Centruroides vittatus TaxID=120091 RepID=UPI00351032D3